MGDLDPWRLDRRLRLDPETTIDPASLISASPATPLADVTTVVHDPHASVALPSEVEEWLAADVSERRRMDFSDFASDALGRHWASLDPHIVYVRNPVNRLVLDPNRARPSRATAREQLVEAIARTRSAAQRGETPRLAGVDTIRTVTFAGLPLLDITRVEADIDGFLDVIFEAAARTVDVYHRTVEAMITRVIAAKRAALSALPDDRGSAAERARIGHLLIVGLHDTSNYTLTADDRLNVAKPETDRLPRYVDFGTRGDPAGEPVGTEPTSMPSPSVEALKDAYMKVFPGAAGFSINAPYRGAAETVQLRDTFGSTGGSAEPVVDVVQVEWNRETLYGEAAAAALRAEGREWPQEASEIDRTIAPLVRDAHALWRGQHRGRPA
ncbi:N-formylglutamate amidohydrolase [Demequina sp. SYSU T00039]|uniref:N-formylglutamate amidohydrolase n=1 Tax=Demequina lignilytica TaxID=3051663 RepID=A0AAW7M8H4_9MICO|nr:MULTISPECIES: N-formylglutamate amidohydrolase [unclassified Demequina]MDN4477951.1 N-formylglutamate amidohydrolase [Demequina sp. SYSU T00039-1]MDN4487860.1 N-formylglutamate amidohydrolase [Demequina sp. SYSU T00039]MDN4490757.1 N-formylglutamate amidohydrolase [Demequina sp. SYSU T00068]